MSAVVVALAPAVGHVLAKSKIGSWHVVVTSPLTRMIARCRLCR